MNGRLVKQWMQQNGVRRHEMALRLGVNESTLWRRLNTVHKCPRTFLLAVSAVTGIAVEMLEGGSICANCAALLEAKKAG